MVNAHHFALFIIIAQLVNINSFSIKDVSDTLSKISHQIESGFGTTKSPQTSESKVDISEGECMKEVTELRKNITDLYIAFVAMHAELAHINQHIGHHERALKHIAYWAHHKKSSNNGHNSRHSTKPHSNESIHENIPHHNQSDNSESADSHHNHRSDDHHENNHDESNNDDNNHNHHNDEHDSNQNNEYNSTSTSINQNDAQLNDDRNRDQHENLVKKSNGNLWSSGLNNYLFTNYSFMEEVQRKMQISESEFKSWFNKMVKNIHQRSHQQNSTSSDSSNQLNNDEHNHEQSSYKNKFFNHEHNTSDAHQDDQTHGQHHHYHNHQNKSHYSYMFDMNNQKLSDSKLEEMEKILNETDSYLFATCAVKPNRHIALLNQQDVYGRINLWQKKENRGPLSMHIKLKGFKVVSHDHRPASREVRETLVSPLEQEPEQSSHAVIHSQKHSNHHSHGFHVHELGNLSRDCQSTGTHYNPYNSDHGGPLDDVRHVGDLGNIRCDENGETDIELTYAHLALSGDNTIIGRSLVIHQLADDYGRNPKSATSITVGSSGVRIACCVIESVEQLPKEVDTQSALSPIAAPILTSRRRRELDGSRAQHYNELVQSFAKYQNGHTYRSRFEIRTSRKYPKYTRE